ncbi:MAG: hypothetical protein H7Z18_01850 [Methylophilaceae bacterium]|nr:hypothetical protein [Methylophilaceae bacterium]
MLDEASTTSLVTWAAAKNAAGNLMIGTEVENAATLASVNVNAGNAINALVSSGSALASVVPGRHQCRSC